MGHYKLSTSELVANVPCLEKWIF